MYSVRDFRFFRMTGLLAVIAALFAIVPASASIAAHAYPVDASNANRAFVVAYQNLNYTVNGSGSVAVNAGTAQKVDLSSITGLATIALDSRAGYVVTASDSLDYVTDNGSNDGMIAAVDENGRSLSKRFLIYNHAQLVSGVSPTKILVVNPGSESILVNLNEGAGGTLVAGKVISPGGYEVFALLNRPAGVYELVSTSDFMTLHGILGDGFTELYPMKNGGFVGTDAVVATPGYVNVVALGEGTISVTERRSVIVGSHEILIDKEFFNAKVKTGEAIHIPDIHSSQIGSFDGVKMVKVKGTALFYVTAGLRSVGALYYGGTYVPPALEGDPGTVYYVAPFDRTKGNTIDVMPVDAGATYTVSKVGDAGTTLSAVSTEGGVHTYQIPDPLFAEATEGKYIETWKITSSPATARYSVYQRHNLAVEHAGIVLSPDVTPTVAPSTGQFVATIVRHHEYPASKLAVGLPQVEVTNYLRITAAVLDLNRDISTVELFTPWSPSTPVTIPVEAITTTAGDGGFLKYEINTGYLGIDVNDKSPLHGEYRLVATDVAGNSSTATTFVRDEASADLKAPGILGPAHNSIGVPQSPVYKWTKATAPYNYASYYRIQVASDAAFTSLVMDFDSTYTLLANYSHATRTDVLLTKGATYYWRILSLGSTLDTGEDFGVMGPTHSFTVISDDDTTPPELVSHPRSIATNKDTITVTWSANETHTGEIYYKSLSGGEIKSVVTSTSAETHNITFMAIGDPGRYSFWIDMTDPYGNTTTTPAGRFTINELSDTENPTFVVRPIITPSSSRASFQWTANEPTTGQISWWTKGIDPATQPDSLYNVTDEGIGGKPRYTSGHSLGIGPLMADTVYYYQVILYDVAGNLGYSPVGVLRTLPTPDTTPPNVVGAPSRSNITDVSTTIGWTTDEVAIGMVLYGTHEDSLNRSSSTGATESPSLTHSITLSGLTEATEYFYQVVSTDGSGNRGLSEVYGFRTFIAPDEVPPAIIPLGAAGNTGTLTPIYQGHPVAEFTWTSNEPTLGWVEVSTASSVIADASRNNIAMFEDQSLVDRFDLPADVTLPTDGVHRIPLDITPHATEETTYYVMAIVHDAAGNYSSSIVHTLVVPSQSVIDGYSDVTPPDISYTRVDFPSSPNRAQFTISVSEDALVKVVVASPSRTSQLELVASGSDPGALPVYESSTPYTRDHKIYVDYLHTGSTHKYVVIAEDGNGNVARSRIKQFTVRMPRVHHLFGMGVHPSLASLGYGPFSTATKPAVTIPAIPPTSPQALHQQLLSQGYVDLTAIFKTLGVIAQPLNQLGNPTAWYQGVNVPPGTRTMNFVVPIPSSSLWTPVVPGKMAADAPTMPDSVEQWVFVIEVTDYHGNTITWPPSVIVSKTAKGITLKLGKAAGGRQGSGVFSVAPVVDATPPTFTSGPKIAARGKGWATVEWTSDEPTSGVIRYVQGAGGAGKLARAADGDTTVSESSTETVERTHTIVINVPDDGGAVTYEVSTTDAHGNGETTSETQTFTTTVEADLTAPIISEGPTVISKTNDRVVIRWVTDEPADGQIDLLERGEDLEERVTVKDGNFTNEHVFTIPGLTEETVYDFLVSSGDKVGNGPTTSDVITFATEKAPDVTAPVIVDAPVITKKDDITAIIEWKTDEPADSYVDFGETTSYGKVMQTSDRVTEHRIVLTNLTAGTVYQYRVQAEDASGNVYVQASPLPFTTDAGPDLTAPAVPAGLIGDAGNAAVCLKWDANTEADFAGYSLERSTDGVNFAPISTNLDKTGYVDAGLTNGTTYHYQLIAVDDSRNHNKSVPTAAVIATPDVSKAPLAPTTLDKYFLYYDMGRKIGEVNRPIMRINNVPPVSRPGAQISYEFVVASDNQFQNIIATGSQVAPGDSVIGRQGVLSAGPPTRRDGWVHCVWDGGNSNWFPVVNGLPLDTTSMAPATDTTAWIPTRDMIPGRPYYWKTRAFDGVFYGPWSAMATFDLNTPNTFLLHPDRATYFGIDLRPEYVSIGKVTPVSLAAFTAKAERTAIAVSWSVAGSEAIGTYLQRGTSTDPASFTRVSPLLPMDGTFLDVLASPGVTYYYRVEVATSSGTSKMMGMLRGSIAVPMRLTLGQNTPNPFNPTTVIPYALPEQSLVNLKVFDLNGRLVRRLVTNQTLSAGYYRASWDGNDGLKRAVGSGVYLYRLESVPASGGARQTRVQRMIMVK